MTRHRITNQPGDVWAFGMTLLEIEGKLCPQEVQQGSQEWPIKFKTNRIKQWASYKEDTTAPKSEVGYSQVGALCDYGLVKRSVAPISDQDPYEISTAEVARRDILADYRPRRVRDSSASRGRPSPSHHSNTRSPTAERRERDPCPPPSSTGRARVGRDGSELPTPRSRRDPSHDSRRWSQSHGSVRGIRFVLGEATKQVVQGHLDKRRTVEWVPVAAQGYSTGLRSSQGQ